MRRSRRRRAAKISAAILLVLAAARPALGGALPFSSAQSIGAGHQSSTFADIDGDGDLDAVASPFSGAIGLLWFENTGAAWVSHTISQDGKNSPRVPVADLDGDGDLDVVAYDTVSGNLVWFGNTSGNGSTWSSTQTIAALPNTPLDILVGPIDRDGDLDVVATIPLTGVRWYENTGSGWTSHPFASGNAEEADLADLDRDGDLDVLVAFGTGDDRIAWYANDGAGSFGSQQPIVLVHPRDALAADLDGDGDLDVAATYGPNVKWFENTAGNASAWSAAQSIVTASSNVGGLSASDLDADGDLDLAANRTFDGGVEWYENSAGDASAWTLRPIEAYGFVAAGLTQVHDLDSDGDLDVATCAPSFVWYENESIHRSAAFVAPTTIDAAADLPYWVSAGDLDRDGDQDALIINVGTTGGIRWRANMDGAGGFGPANLIASAFHARVIRLADMDRDGDPDLVTAATGTPGLAWLENTTPATALSWTTRTISGTYPLPFRADVGDIDGDGDPDVLASNSPGSGTSIAWFENTAGNASAWSEHLVSTIQGIAGDVRLADVDGDGDLDAFYCDTNYSNIGWKENTAGNGSAWTDHEFEIGAPTTTPNAMEPVDMDRDGDVDVVVASRASNNSAWFENTNGSGTSWIRHSLASPAKLFWLRASDLDLDGDLDVVGTGEEADRLYRFENTSGDGTAWSVEALPGTIDQPFGLDLADLDDDGDDDLLAAGFASNDVISVINRGGQFALPTVRTAYLGMVDSQLRQVFSIEFAHRGRAGDSDAELAAIELRLANEAGSPLSAAEADQLFSSIALRAGQPLGPVIVSANPPFSLTNGVLTLTVADGDPAAQLDATQSAALHLTVKLKLAASTASPNRFQIEHLTQSSSRAEDASTDLPLALEYQADTSTGVIQALPKTGDYDGDGVANGTEADTHETDPGDSDTDDDGASDGLEVNTLGSNPLDVDSDDDGLQDGAEVTSYGTSPTDPDSEDDGYCDGPLAVGGCTAGDNCPASSNAAQTNSDAFAAGDACQCGDVTGEGTLTALDYQRAREHVAGRTPGGSFVASRCDVSGDGLCGVADLAILDRLTHSAPATLLNSCAAYTTP